MEEVRTQFTRNVNKRKMGKKNEEHFLLNSPYDRKNKIRRFFWILVGLVGFDYLTRSFIYQQSIPFLKTIRKQYTSDELDDVVESVGAAFTGHQALFYIVFFAYFSMDLSKTMTVLMNAMATMCFLAFLRSLNHEGRPSLSSASDIQLRHCVIEYGNPCQNSLVASSVLNTAWDMVTREMGWK